jgi:hypothetical protein
MQTQEMNTQYNHYIIDVETSDKDNIIESLEKFPGTLSVKDGGMYHQDHNYSQVLLTSEKTEVQIDSFLYEGNFDYVGVVQVDENGEQI